MKIVVAGTRGIPGIQGGVETHCEELYPLLVNAGFDVTVIRRRRYAEAVEAARGLDQWRGVKLCDLFAPRSKSLEAIVHTFLAVVKARRMGADIMHIHAVGPSLMAPLARLLGMKVVMTNHGPDYDRAKWGALARSVLRLGERAGSLAAHRVIAISPHIAGIVKSNYGRTATVIPNGVPTPQVPGNAEEIIKSLWGLQARKYVVAIGRFVPEKGFHFLIEAFTMLLRDGRIPADTKLVIAGDADHPDDYSRSLKAKAAEAPGVILTGFIKGEPLQSLMAEAALFAMPSSHEGLPIALLEAMSHRLDVATSDIPSCLLPELEPADHFALLKDNPELSAANLADIIERKLSENATPRSYDMTRYSWPAVADATAEVYLSLSPKAH